MLLRVNGFTCTCWGWDDLRRAFEKRSQRSLKAFFDQWVNRKGAPRIHLADVRRNRAPDGWKVTGRLAQDKPFFQAEFELALDGGGRHASRRVELSGESASFRDGQNRDKGSWEPADSPVVHRWK